MKKVTEQNKELESVAGGGMGDDSVVTCPNCRWFGNIGLFNGERVNGRCTDDTRITCPKCGYSWVVD